MIFGFYRLQTSPKAWGRTGYVRILNSALVEASWGAASMALIPLLRGGAARISLDGLANEDQIERYSHPAIAAKKMMRAMTEPACRV